MNSFLDLEKQHIELEELIKITNENYEKLILYIKKKYSNFI